MRAESFRSRRARPIAVEARRRRDPIAELEAKLAVAREGEEGQLGPLPARRRGSREPRASAQKREIDDAKVEAQEQGPQGDAAGRRQPRARDRARGAGAEGGATQPIVEGVQLVLRQFMTAFERLDVTPVEALGQPFDPNLHEAISQQESDQPPGSVVQVLQRGYTLRRSPAAPGARRRREGRRRAVRSNVAGRRDRPRHHQLVRRRSWTASAGRDRELRGHAHDAVGRRLRRSRRAARRPGRAPPGDDERRRTRSTRSSG